MSLLVNTSALSLWREIIQEAKACCATPLRDELEAYLVLLLARFTNKPEILSHIIATQFLESLNLSPRHREIAFQAIGDTCLIFSGLFPGMAAKRLVKISYFIGLGQTAYNIASKTRHDIYSALARQFVQLMDILQSTRQYTRDCPNLLPLEAYELWNEAGSQRALQVLRQYTHGALVATPSISLVIPPSNQLK